MLNPGQPFPPEAPLPSSVSDATSTPLPSSGVKKHGLTPGAIAGIVIAAISVIVLAALLFFFWGRNKTLKDEVERKESSVVRRTNSMTQSSPHPTGNGGVFQHYSTTSPQPFASPPHSQYAYNNASYFSPHQQDQKYTSPTMSQHPAFAFTSPHNPNVISPTTYELPHNPDFSNPSQRSASPHCLSVSPAQQDQKLGAYGQQSAGPAPPYGFHVNSALGPQEIEGTPVGKGSVVEREKGMGARWEEVKGEEGRMF